MSIPPLQLWQRRVCGPPPGVQRLHQLCWQFRRGHRMCFAQLFQPIGSSVWAQLCQHSKRRGQSVHKTSTSLICPKLNPSPSYFNIRSIVGNHIWAIRITPHPYLIKIPYSPLHFTEVLLCCRFQTSLQCCFLCGHWWMHWNAEHCMQTHVPEHRRVLHLSLLSRFLSGAWQQKLQDKRYQFVCFFFYMQSFSS